MDSKVRIGAGDTTAADEKACLEEQRADDAVRALSRLKRRIREFYNEVSYVSFDDADGAPAWAPNWLDYLLSGRVPEVAEPDPDPEATAQVAADVEVMGEERPEVEPADFELVRRSNDPILP